jgi:hypothetical protein
MKAMNINEHLRGNELNYAVCFLVINSIPELPNLAISSCLNVTKCPIIVGYLHEEDLLELPSDPRIFYFKLDIPDEFQSVFSSSNRDYKNFHEEDFFKIVTVKWQLFKKLLRTDLETLIYSDLDVIWLRDASYEIENTFKKFQELDVLIQSIPSIPSEPRLCMGLVGFRNSKNVHDLVSDAHDIHLNRVLCDEKFGDDDAITEYYNLKGFPNWIKELPQTLFPVGKLLNSFSSRNLMPGLFLDSPYIFHANYVSGIRNKRLILRIFFKNQHSKFGGIKLTPYWGFILITKKIRHKVRLGRLLKFDR